MFFSRNTFCLEHSEQSRLLNLVVGFDPNTKVILGAGSWIRNVAIVFDKDRFTRTTSSRADPTATPRTWLLCPNLRTVTVNIYTRKWNIAAHTSKTGEKHACMLRS